MRCPNCSQRIHQGAIDCPHCGFHFSELEGSFPELKKEQRSLVDHAGVFRRYERDKIHHEIKQITGLFENLELIIQTCTLPREEMLQAYSLYCLNHISEINPGDSCARIVFVLEPDLRLATISYSYHFEGILKDQHIFGCLSRGHAHWLQGRYLVGTLRCLRKLSDILKKETFR